MSIQKFIQDQVLTPRLSKSQVLVVYDPDHRYRDLCLEMWDEKCVVVDATESSIESRALAMSNLGKLGAREVEQLLVYVPAPKPVEDEEKQRDPFALYTACGEVFPRGDGDSYFSLCLKAKLDHTTEVRSIFEQDSNPSFAVIDAIGGGLNWPNLRALLNVESTQDILFALLVPNEWQLSSLKENEAWVAEAKQLLKISLGLDLKTSGKTWKTVANEFWRYLLFSEFVYDLPEALPQSLSIVPHAEDPARPLIDDICERLRNDRRTKNAYIERAEFIEQELGLREACGEMLDLGERDTFPFEERTFLQRAMEALLKDDTDRVNLILTHHEESVWTGKGESQIQWGLLHSATDLITACQDNERVLSDHARSMENLLDFYVSQFREVDRLHREFEQAASDYEWRDAHGVMQPVQEQARSQYGKLIEKVQLLFTRHLQQTGWPLAGRLSNADVFDTQVAPRLRQSGNKVAYLMVDALRYELGVELKKQLADAGKVDIKPALVQLPSITAVGMASLLPGAGAGLRLVKSDKGFTPTIDDSVVGNVAQRMDFIRKRYGQRFQEGRLEEFVRNRFEIKDDIELLVLRSVEIDTHFENSPDTAPGEILTALQRIRMAIHKLKAAGFMQVVIASDHGFVMNTHAGAGDTCTKLEGDWINIHNRCLLGVGGSDSHHYVINTEKAGIRGDFANIAGPLSLAAYQSGVLYFHGGASLQECIVPVICLEMEPGEDASLEQAAVVLNYKNGAKRITTRLPVVEIGVQSQSLFSQDNECEILLEAYDKKGNSVGSAKSGGVVNAATGTITLMSGSNVKVTLKMDMEFEGKFKLKALNPATMTVYDQLDLETDYTV